MKRISLVLMLLFATLQAFSFSVKEAAAAYSKGDYHKAVEEYEAIIKQNGASAELLYNLGNCYYQSGNRQGAVLCYERALRIDPGNIQIMNNLDYLYSKISDTNKGEAKGKNVKTTIDTPTFFESLRNNIGRNYSSNFWAGWAAACFVGFIICFALYVFISNVLIRKIGFFTGLIMLLGVVFFIPFSFMSAKNQMRADEAVIINYKTELLADPDIESKPSSLPLTTGTKVYILTTESDDSGEVKWYKVRLNSDYIGWISADKIEII